MNRREFLKGVIAGAIGGIVGRLWPGRQEQVELDGVNASIALYGARVHHHALSAEEIREHFDHAWDLYMKWLLSKPILYWHPISADGCVGILHNLPTYDNRPMEIAIHYGQCSPVDDGTGSV